MPTAPLFWNFTACVEFTSQDSEPVPGVVTVKTGLMATAVPLPMVAVALFKGLYCVTRTFTSLFRSFVVPANHPDNPPAAIAKWSDLASRSDLNQSIVCIPSTQYFDSMPGFVRRNLQKLEICAPHVDLHLLTSLSPDLYQSHRRFCCCCRNGDSGIAPHDQAY